jgi:hypothetical protein
MAALILVYRENKTAGVTELLKRSLPGNERAIFASVA